MIRSAPQVFPESAGHCPHVAVSGHIFSHREGELLPCWKPQAGPQDTCCQQCGGREAPKVTAGRETTAGVTLDPGPPGSGKSEGLALLCSGRLDLWPFHEVADGSARASPHFVGQGARCSLSRTRGQPRR